MTTKTRASGLTAAEEEAKEVVEESFADPATEDPGEERKVTFRTPGFSRMRTDWNGDDALVLSRVQMVIEDRIVTTFADAFSLMHEVYEVVRTPLTDAEGNIQRDRFGFPIWRRTPAGSFEEDWTRLGTKERENFLFQITTRIFDWEQRAADAWTEAMLAKAIYEERFSIAYDAPKTGTIDDRTARGKTDAADERYFAILMAAYSRKADALVRSLALLGQRLKDAMSL